MSKKREQNSVNTVENQTPRAAGGDVEKADFEELARRYDKVIRTVACGFDVPESEREDLYQEGLIALYRAFLTYKSGVAVFSTYAGTCIRNAMLTWIRDHRAVGGALSLDEGLEDMLCDTEGPEETYLSKENVTFLKKKALSVLSDFERCVFLLYLEEHSAQEMAEALGRSRKSVENALDRIRKKLSSGRK